MGQKQITVKEGTIREWIKKALNEFGTVPQMQNQPPISPVRKDVVDSGEVMTLPPYRAGAEKRPSPRSTKSTRAENGLQPEDLQKISSGLNAQEVDIDGKTWTQEDLYIPERRSLGVSGIRKELETGSDKIQVTLANPDIVIQMLERAVKDYKLLLKEPLRVVQVGLREYVKDLEGSGQLTIDEVKELRTAKGQAALASGRGFNEFFNEWIMNDAPTSSKRIFQKSEPMWFRSIFTLARAGTLDLNDATPARRSLSEDFLLESKHRTIPSVIDRALILRDPGFRYFVGGLGGKHVYYWDWVRNEAARLGRYSGQF